ncbi:MAG: hypothetical protein FJY20_10020 [Bacteroidetes bacterium]|nr:hypothetical protein [Bacteroidota bacterium]
MRFFVSIIAIVCICREANAVAGPVNCFPEKILLVQVDEIGLIKIGRDTVGSDQLARYIQERLFKSYMGTGQMHDRIRIEKTEITVPDLVMEVILKEIKEGQRRALSEFCVLKYRKGFDDLDRSKQSRIKKKFPVLFQQTYF